MRVVPRPITCLHVNRLQYGAIPLGRGKPSDCLVNAVPVNVKYYFTSSVFRHDLPGITDRICVDNFTKNLLQRRVLRFRSDENRNVRVGVFPKREEILIPQFLSPGPLFVHVIKYPDTARHFLHGHNQLVVAERKPDWCYRPGNHQSRPFKL